MRKAQQFTDEFKRKAVAALENRGDKSIKEVAKDLGVASSRIYKWRQEAKEDGVAALAERAVQDGTGPLVQIATLRAEKDVLIAEVQRLHHAIGVLKRAIKLLLANETEE